MALSTVTVEWSVEDIAQAGSAGSVTFQLSGTLVDTATGDVISPSPPRQYPLTGVQGESDPLVANDNASLDPPGSYYIVTLAGAGGSSSYNVTLNAAAGAVQTLGSLLENQVLPAPPMSRFLPLPSGTAEAGYVPVATGSGESTQWAPGGTGGGSGYPAEPAVTGTPVAGQVLTATSATQATWETPSGGGSGGGVGSVTAADPSVVVGGTASAPTVRTATLDVIAAQHPPAANVPMNNRKLTGLANGSAATDSVAYGQLGTAAFQPATAFDTAGAAMAAQSAAQAASLPAPTGTPAAGYVPVATGTGAATAWGPAGTGGSGYPAEPAVTGTPVAGQVLTAVSGTSATWQTPASGAWQGGVPAGYWAPKIVSVADAATIGINAAQGNAFRVTLTAAVGASRTVAAPSNPADGQQVTFEFIQPSSGGPCAVTWATGPGGFTFPGALPVLSAGAGAMDLLPFTYSGALQTWRYTGGGSGSSSGTEQPAVAVTTTGATFSPSVTLAAGSTATVTWSSPGYAPVAGTQPVLSFGTPGTRTVYMSATDDSGYDALDQIVTFNVGFSNTDDAGQSSLDASYNWPAQAVSGISNVRAMSGLEVFCAADIPGLTGLLDFSNMGQLQHVECYQSQITGVIVSGCTSMIRLCVEQCNLTELDINPVQPGLLDLRSANQHGGTLTFKPLAVPALSEWHFCVRDQVVTNMPDFATQFPALKEMWTWNTGQSGVLAPGSKVLTNVQAYSNAYTAATFADGAFSANDTYLDLNSNQLTSITLPAANGLQYVDLHNNQLPAGEVNAVLENLAGNTISNGECNLGGSGNAAPSGAGLTAVTTLRGRGWTVTVAAGGGGGTGGSFTHQDSAHNSGAAASLAVTLPQPVSAGDLLVMMVYTGDGAAPTDLHVTDTSGNTWSHDATGQLWYCLHSAAAAGGLTVTAAITGTGNTVRQMVADRFTPSGAVTLGATAETGASGTLGLNYNTTGCGDVGIVPAGALAWGAFTCTDTSGTQVYTHGYQTGTTTPVNVIGSQFAGANGTGLSVYVTSCANEDATLTWYGTGTGAIGSAVSAYFTSA